LSVTGSANDAEGTVEDVTLRVTRLRTSDGEVTTIPNGQIVKSQNLSKDWARAVVNIPVPTVTDLNRVTDALHGVSQDAMHDQRLSALLLDAPSVMGLESIDVDRVDLRMVARTLPGTQFEVSRRLRTLVASALRRAGVAYAGVTTSADAADASPPEAAAGSGRDLNS
jgi:small conductance mechanosensitive channel